MKIEAQGLRIADLVRSHRDIEQSLQTLPARTLAGDDNFLPGRRKYDLAEIKRRRRIPHQHIARERRVASSANGEAISPLGHALHDAQPSLVGHSRGKGILADRLPEHQRSGWDRRLTSSVNHMEGNGRALLRQRR